MLNAMSPVPKPNFEFSPYNLHKTKWPPNGQKTAYMGRLESKRPLIVVVMYVMYDEPTTPVVTTVYHVSAGLQLGVGFFLITHRR